MATERLFSQPDVEPETIAGVLARAGYDVGPWQPVRRSLLDTFDGRLHRAGLRLEARSSGGLELVLSGGGPAVAGMAVPALPTLAGDLPAGPFRARLQPVLDVRALLPVLTVTGRQLVGLRRDRTGKAVVAVTVHDRLATDRPLTPSWAAEVEEFEGYPAAATRARQELRSVGLQPLAGDIFELAAVAAGVDLSGFSSSPTVALDHREPAIDGFRRVLSNLVQAIDANWQGTLDAVDPEFLHDLRVAVRRSRSVLALGKKVLPGDVRDRYREGFGWLGAATGPARDLDVYLIEWAGYVAPLGSAVGAALVPVVDHIAGQCQAEHAALAEMLRSDKYRSLMAAWRDWLAAPYRPGGALPLLGPVVSERLADAQNQLVGRGRRIGPATPAEELHELRKDAKKLRYLLECFGGVLPPAPRRAFVDRLKALQDNLGEHQDTEVHAGQLRSISRQMADAGAAPPELLLAMGQLTEAFERRRMAARADFADRFAAYDTKQTRRTFDELVKAAAR